MDCCRVARRCTSGGVTIEAVLRQGRGSREAGRPAQVVDGRQLSRGSLFMSDQRPLIESAFFAAGDTKKGFFPCRMGYSELTILLALSELAMPGTIYTQHILQAHHRV